MPSTTQGYAAQSATSGLAPFDFDRRDLRADDVKFEVLYCGVCHTDLHQARNDWGSTKYPIVPGHEIVGRVLDVGSGVARFKVGDNVAVGCMVDSCKACTQCHAGEEQYCSNGRVGTYASKDRITGEPTYGGYSKTMVTRDEFVLKVPAGLDLARAAPLLCAGITTYSPLRVWNVGPGTRVGVVGLGGLGHMAVKIAAAMGAIVTVISRTADKKEEATTLGADKFLISTSKDEMAKANATLDLIIDTVPVEHDLGPYVPLLKIDGTLVLVGQIGGGLSGVTPLPLVAGRRRIAGSLIGGIAQTQELLDFCARKNVLPECEMIKMEEINTAFDRMEKSDVRYRFVIDMASMK